MAGLTIPATWINCSADDIKVGMEAKVIEHHRVPRASGDHTITVTIEGEVTGEDGEHILFGPVSTTRGPRSSVRVEFYRLPRKLPMAEGSLIKVYDVQFLQDRAAVYVAQYEGQRQLVGKWVFTDRGQRDVPEAYLESAEVLFDAGSR